MRVHENCFVLNNNFYSKAIEVPKSHRVPKIQNWNQWIFIFYFGTPLFDNKNMLTHLLYWSSKISPKLFNK